MSGSDIVITWPRTKALGAYLENLAIARQRGHVAYYKLANRPKVVKGDRCYHVYKGFVRGHLNILEIVEMTEQNALYDHVAGTHFSPGLYLVRDPEWFPLKKQLPMKGFQGFRYYRQDMHA